MTDKTMFRLNPAKNPFLGNLPEAAMEDLLGRAKIQQLTEGDTFIREGEPSDSIYFVNYGEVVILKEVLADRRRALIVGRADEERVCELADDLIGVRLRAGISAGF